MANPATIIGGLSIGSSILGGVFGAKSSMDAARANAQMGMFQAAVAQKNAQTARQNAAYVSAQGDQSAMQAGMKGRAVAGEIRAQQGASGLDVNTGSAKLVQESQHLVTQMDMDQIRQNAAKAAYDYNVTAKNFETEGIMAMMGANNAMSAGNTNALASIVSASGSVADKWLRGKQVGMWGND